MIAELERVVALTHTDPHAVLGPHLDGDAVVVRVLAPGAARVVVEFAAGTVEASREPSVPGIFVARIERPELAPADRPRGAPLCRYRLRIDDGPLTEDPYAYAPLLGELDLHLFAEGTLREIYRVLGAHPMAIDGTEGTRFAVWAPNAHGVAVIGDFNDWRPERAAMRRVGAGVFEVFVPGAGEGALYKLRVIGEDGRVLDKSDPMAFAAELRPQTASRVFRSRHRFTDQDFIARRAERQAPGAPMSIYEVHLGSWRRRPNEPAGPEGAPRRWLTYRELAEELVDYVADLGFSHIELLPVLEHPYDGSWGYQVTGYFAPTARHGTPDDFRAFVDRAHARGLGVLLDWVPAHFPRDAHGLGRFDGTPLYEHWDPRRGEHKQWETFIFDWGRVEVKAFLLASALYWLEELHVDGLRVDAVASMLYLDYGSQHPGDWAPNQHGGRENLEAVAFLRELCDLVHERVPGAIVCAEESTSWPGVTRPTYTGGLGFDLKWNMGWMHDNLAYFRLDPIFRSFHHQKMTFSLWYAYSERFLLPLSHDEVVHLKRSLLGKMPGDAWQALANLRALYALMWAHPGRKLLFMGGEIGQKTEWNDAAELDWHVLGDPAHRSLLTLIRELNRHYRQTPALHERDDHPDGFRWIDANDSRQSVLSFVRIPGSGLSRGRHLIVVANLTPVVRSGYRLGVPRRSDLREVLNTDAAELGGSGVGNLGRVGVEAQPSHGFSQSVVLTLPPLAVLWLEPELEDDPEPALVGEAGETPPGAREAIEAGGGLPGEARGPWGDEPLQLPPRPPSFGTGS